MTLCGLQLLPAALVIITLTTFCVTYIISVSRKDVPAFLPYISDTGTVAPESCIFGFFLNISAVIGFCTMYIHYKVIRSLPSEFERKSRFLNMISVLLGAIAILGISVVANFQEKSLLAVHTTGAVLTFISGTAYMLTQCKLSYMLYPDYCDLPTCRTRLVMGLLCLGFGICLFVGKIVSVEQHHKEVQLSYNVTEFYYRQWSNMDKGYTAHLVGTISEWVMAIVFILFFTTFVQEFKAASLHINVHMSPTYEGLGLRV